MAKALETKNLIFKRSRIHGKGGYARRHLRKGARVIEYFGPKVTKQESLKLCEDGNYFIFTLDGDFDIDGSVPENLARFINHSCSPNCEVEIEGDRVWVIALRSIKAGDEITYDYGYDMEEWGEYPCHCGAPDCCGYMVAECHRETIQRKLKNKGKL